MGCNCGKNGFEPDGMVPADNVQASDYFHHGTGIANLPGVTSKLADDVSPRAPRWTPDAGTED